MLTTNETLGAWIAPLLLSPPSRRPCLISFRASQLIAGHISLKDMCPSPGRTETRLRGIKEALTTPSSLSKLFARSSKVLWKTTYRNVFAMIFQPLWSPIPVARTRPNWVRYTRAGQISSYNPKPSLHRTIVVRATDENGYRPTPTGTLYPNGIPCIIWPKDAINQSMNNLPTCCRCQASNIGISHG